MGFLGHVYRGLGRVKLTIEHYEKALAIHRESGIRRGEAFWSGGLEDAYLRRGQGQRTQKFFEQASNIAREIGQYPNEVWQLDRLGRTCRDLGQFHN